MVEPNDLNLALKGKMIDTDPDCLSRLKTALNGGYSVFTDGADIMIYEDGE